jgi:TPR repeat protein
MTRMFVPSIVSLLIMCACTTTGADDVEACHHTTSFDACRRLAHQGEGWAKHNLGWMYEHGHGVAQDDEQAARWYREAADQGVADSQYNLGVLYANGRGVPRDDKEAVFWYRKAANQKFGDGHYNLGWMYFRGTGLPQDHARAYMCFNLAAEEFPPGQYRQDAIDSRDLAAGKLTPEQIEDAKRRAQEWQPGSDEL